MKLSGLFYAIQLHRYVFFYRFKEIKKFCFYSGFMRLKNRNCCRKIGGKCGTPAHVHQDTGDAFNISVFEQPILFFHFIKKMYHSLG